MIRNRKEILNQAERMVRSYSEPHNYSMKHTDPFRTQRKYERMYSKYLNRSILLTSVKLVKLWCVKRLSQMAKAGFGQTT